MRIGVEKEGQELENVLEEIERACVIQCWTSQTMWHDQFVRLPFQHLYVGDVDVITLSEIKANHLI